MMLWLCGCGCGCGCDCGGYRRVHTVQYIPPRGRGVDPPQDPRGGLKEEKKKKRKKEKKKLVPSK